MTWPVTTGLREPAVARSAHFSEGGNSAFKGLCAAPPRAHTSGVGELYMQGM